MRSLRTALRVLLLCLCAPSLAGCETVSYYAQAVGGHLEIVSRARPLDEVVADAATPSALRGRLEVAAAIRSFASRVLKLPDNGSYRRYAALERRYAVWNVVAAPEFSLAAVQSCFPFAGCVSYRGFFAQADAQAHAASLRARGLDVLVYGVPAYSTLGWFDDPLLSTFIGYPDAELARLVFHELAHQVVYVRGDSTFNESFAVVVEEEGVKRWLRASGTTAGMEAYRTADARKRAFVALIEDARLRLGAIYAAKLAPQTMRARKREAFDGLKARYAVLKASWGGYAGYDRFFAAPDNALLASIATYTGRAPEFRRLFAQSGGDFAAFYERVRAVAAARDRADAPAQSTNAQEESRMPTPAREERP